MKLKKLLVSIALVTASSITLAGGAEAFVLGAIVGSVITQPKQVYSSPIYSLPVYVQPPQIVYQMSTAQQPTIIIDHSLDGYCPYQGELYYRCQGNIQRKKMEEAYVQGFNGQ